MYPAFWLGIQLPTPPPPRLSTPVSNTANQKKTARATLDHYHLKGKLSLSACRAFLGLFSLFFPSLPNFFLFTLFYPETFSSIPIPPSLTSLFLFLSLLILLLPLPALFWESLSPKPQPLSATVRRASRASSIIHHLRSQGTSAQPWRLFHVPAVARALRPVSLSTVRSPFARFYPLAHPRPFERLFLLLPPLGVVARFIYLLRCLTSPVGALLAPCFPDTLTPHCFLRHPCILFPRGFA